MFYGNNKCFTNEFLNLRQNNIVIEGTNRKQSQKRSTKSMVRNGFPFYFLFKIGTTAVMLIIFASSASCYFYPCLQLLVFPCGVLIWRHCPAHYILFALQQDKHCVCVTPKTFHRLSRFQHGPRIALIGAFLLRDTVEERGRVKKLTGSPLFDGVNCRGLFQQKRYLL